MDDIFLSVADSEREKTKERISEWVGEETNSSWSCGLSIRRVGVVKTNADVSGGRGRGVVSGAGRGFWDGALFFRGIRRGSLSRRVGSRGPVSPGGGL